MCGVISPDPEIWNDIWLVGCTMSIVSKDYTFRFCIPYFTSVESQHLWLAYASREKFEHERSDQLSNSTCIHARFGINTWVRNWNSKVIKCGIRPVYKKDTECFQESPPAEAAVAAAPPTINALMPRCLEDAKRFQSNVVVAQAMSIGGRRTAADDPWHWSKRGEGSSGGARRGEGGAQGLQQWCAKSGRNGGG
ncbi:hypothetical protein JRO89_XS07G0284300 [Xanthoceras sorbifolium]|uniref:Uncharacterized protein n=1 Tax=Xanthoceras sorbifolium TaxID=99658 RepID=A0ABQ8HVJ6_9ROSI|nr:hypothetical protein JRO89_XS07G0284300 [Xanthoceras sorbifolium]